MITLGTGLPGNGKTLFMLWYLAAKAKKENREVFYHNVKGLDVQKVGPWQPFDPEKWMELPHGAMVLIDECQEVFRKLPNGSKPPAHYEALATHRHKGLDIFLITQHPTLIDNFVRRLVGQHFHSVRKFGLQRSTVYEWSSAQAAPELVSTQKSAVTLKWKYPKEVFTWYKSAEVHTVKRAIPAKLILAVVGVVAFVGFGYWVLDRYQHRYDKKEVAAVAPGAVAPVAIPGAVGVAPGLAHAPVDPVADLKEYVWKGTPRVAGLQETAPKYDALTVPVRVPIPAMCIQKGSVRNASEMSCKCWSQQATPMDVPFNMCIEFARNGFFREFDADKDQQQVARADASEKVLSNRPDASREVRPVQDGPRVAVLPGASMGVQRTEKSPGLNEPGVIDDGPPNNRATRAAAGAARAQGQG
jgi:zona occludens toxin